MYVLDAIILGVSESVNGMIKQSLMVLHKLLQFVTALHKCLIFIVNLYTVYLLLYYLTLIVNRIQHHKAKVHLYTSVRA